MFRPSINGFSISNLKTMNGMDGLVISCSILKDGKKVGLFYDGGDGAPYRFDGPDSIEKEVAAFPPFDYESYDWKTGEPEVKKMDWDLGILVDDLMNLRDDYRDFRNLNLDDRWDAIAVIDVHRAGKKYNLMFNQKAKTDEDIRKQIDREMKETILPTFPPAYRNAGYKVKIYRKEEDFTVSL